MSTYSPSLRIELITTGDQAGAWGNTTNTNLGTLIETAIAGYTSISVTSANQAFTALDGAADQSRHAVIALTTTTAAVFNVYAPPAEKTYVIQNASSFVATIFNSTVIGNTTAAGTGVAVPAGKTVAIWSDGTNFAFQNNHLSSLTLATDLAIADGGTGQSTQQTAINALVGAQTANRVLRSDGTNSTLAQVALATDVTGTLPIANGGTGATTAAVAITGLGATTVGGNMFTLTNPSAVTFPRFNADNTVSALNAADFRTAIGAGTGGGTVTSVTGTSPVASTGGATPAISLAAAYGDALNPYASKTANTFLAAPNAAAGVPTFRAIVAADIPTLNQNTTGTAAGLSATLAVASGGTGLTTYTANGVLFASGTGTIANGTGLTFAGGNLGLGVASPFYKLDVETTSGGVTPFVASFTNTSTSTTQANIIRITQAASGAATGYIGTGGSAYSDVSFRNSFVVGTLTANPLVFNTAGVERARIDSLGNLGLGASPSAWGTGYKAFDVNTFGSVNSTGSNMRVTSNAFFNGTQWIRKIEAEATRYDQTAGEHKWFIGPYGAAGASVAFTQAMSLKQTGAGVYLGVGETAPTTALFVASPDSTVATFRNTDGSTAHISFYNDSGISSTDVLCGSENSTFVIYTGGTKRVVVDDLGSLKMITGPVMPYAPAPNVLTTNGTLTNAIIQAQIINTTGSMTVVAMPTGATLESSNLWLENNIGYDFYVINTASGTVAITANTGVTTLGALTVATDTSAQFRIRRTAASTFVLYRLG